MTKVSQTVGQRRSLTRADLRAEQIFEFIEGNTVHVGAVYMKFAPRWTPTKVDRALRDLQDRSLVREFNGCLATVEDMERAA